MNTNEKWNKGIEEIKKEIILSDMERSQIFRRIQSSSPASEAVAKNPWTTYSFMLVWNRNRTLYCAVISCLIILSARQIAYASQDSLPGDALYKIKIDIVEPLRGAFIFSSGAKAQYESSLVIKRLVEAETLASQNKLDDSKQKQISALIENNTNTLSKDLKNFSKARPDDVDAVVTNFQAQINAHARTLETIASDKDTDIEVNNAQIANTARESGAEIKDNFKNKNNNDANKNADKKLNSKEKNNTVNG
jgi:hypothetical protein